MASSKQNSGGDPASSSPIFQAIAKGDPDQLSKALAACTSYSDLDVCDSSDETPLMKAAWCKGEHKKRILQLLWVRHLQLGNDNDDDSGKKASNLQETLQRKDDDGFNLLAHAAFHGDEEMLELVLGFYKQSFDNLSFIKESLSSADLKDDERKKLTKVVGNCLARLPPAAVQNQINNYYKAKAIQEEPEPKNVVPASDDDDDDDDDESSSDGEVEGDEDDDKTPKQTNTSPARKSAPVPDSDDEESSSASDGEADDVMKSENANTDNGNISAISLRGDQRDEVLTTIHCMKTLAVPLHAAMKKGKTGPTEVAKMEAIMMLMRSIEEMINKPTGG